MTKEEVKSLHDYLREKENELEKKYDLEFTIIDTVNYIEFSNLFEDMKTAMNSDVLFDEIHEIEFLYAVIDDLKTRFKNGEKHAKIEDLLFPSNTIILSNGMVLYSW